MKLKNPAEANLQDMNAIGSRIRLANQDKPQVRDGTDLDAYYWAWWNKVPVNDVPE